MIGALMTYVFLNAARPSEGKLSKPHESPTPLKNHLKQFQRKLMLKSIGYHHRYGESMSVKGNWYMSKDPSEFREW